MKQNKPSFSNGIRCYSEALGFMFKHNLWHYFFYPLILNVGLFFIGFQLIASGFKAPIVALTADVTPESMEASKTAGMVDYITKPIDQQRLKKVLNKYL